MIIEVACGVVLGLAVFHLLTDICKPLVEWWIDQHWFGKIILFLIIVWTTYAYMKNLN